MAACLTFDIVPDGPPWLSRLAVCGPDGTSVGAAWPEDCNSSAMNVTPGYKYQGQTPAQAVCSKCSQKTTQKGWGPCPLHDSSGETLSPRVWLAQNQDGLLQIQLHVFFPLQIIFLLEEYRNIWLIFQVLWQPLKFLKLDR